jgi:hypothetical protein
LIQGQHFSQAERSQHHLAHPYLEQDKRGQGTEVKGTITIEQDASLIASQVAVSGSIKATKASLVIVKAGSTVAGNIEVKESDSGEINTVQVNGNILLESNSGLFSLMGNWLSGNMQVFKNTGEITLVDNSIEGNLQCKENKPPPSGTNNIVHGNLEDQCTTLGN